MTGQEDTHARFSKGELVFREGNRGDRIYEIESGEVLMFKLGHQGNRVPLGKVGPGEMIGESFLLDDAHAHDTSAVAVSEVVVRIHLEDLIIQDMVDMTPRQRKLVKSLTTKLNQLTEAYVREITEILHGNPERLSGRSVRPSWQESAGVSPKTVIRGDRVIRKT